MAHRTTASDIFVRDEAPGIPELGQVVSVRGSTWAVTGVRKQEHVSRPGRPSNARASHVVELQSLAEDRLGEELAVIWELEVGHGLLPGHGLPETLGAETFDDPNMLAAFVDSLRWGAVTSASSSKYQSPFRSGVNVEAYQLEPLRRALESPRTNLLLADDVGLGKTIEAGLVVQELLLRDRARSAVIVCPPSLRLKWQDEMRDRFGLDFTIVDRELLAEVRRNHGLAANPFRLFPRTIVSMAWLPTPRAQRLLREVYADLRTAGGSRQRYAFDMLVVDEAHHVAPASPTAVGGARGYAVDSQRTIATRALAERCEHRLFLSATPHNGYTESFTALMEMIDGRRFARGAILDESALKQVAVRRLKTQITEKQFKTRELKTIPFDPASEEQEQFELLERILTESARRHGRHRSGDIVSMLLKKRFLSSPWSFALTLHQYSESPEAGRLFENRDYYQDIMGSGQSDEEEGEADHPEAEALLSSKSSAPLAGATTGQVDALIEWGRSFEQRPDSKLSALIGFLTSLCRADGRHWSNERVVIFTEYASTLEWIARNLRQAGLGEGLAVIQGSTQHEDREAIKARFNAPPEKEKVRILLATDSAGEGIDLQTHCHRLINYDVPFNPSRIEQRIGRIDRYGQNEQPLIFQFQPSATSATFAADADFMRRIAQKIGHVSADLGSANQVIDTDAEIEARFSTASNRRRRPKRAPENGSEVIANALTDKTGLDRRLTRLVEDYDETKAAMHWKPSNARRVLDTALRLSGQPTLIPVADDELNDDPEDETTTDAERYGATLFQIPNLATSWQPALSGLDTRLEPGEWRPITFDDQAAAARSDIVRIHLGHKLMQRATRFLRSELSGGDTLLHRVCATVVDDLEESCIAAVSRLVLVGRGGLRLHEEVFLTGLRLNGRPLAQARTELAVDQVLDREHLDSADPELRAALARHWNAEGSRLRTNLLKAMDGKADTLQEKVRSDLVTREAADLERSEAIFSAFRVNLRESISRLQRSLDKEVGTLFGVDNRGEADLRKQQEDQLRSDLRSMDDRLRALDDEQREEQGAIRDRYTEIKPHLTGAAVVFALTPADAAQWKAAR